MPIVVFRGRVLPSVIRISFQQLPSIQWQDTALDFKMSFTVTIDESKIQITGDLDKYSDAFIASLNMRALDIARAIIDLACFAKGYGATVILDTLTKPDGTEVQILPHDPSLEPLCTAFKLGLAPNLDLEKMLKRILTEPALFMAMNDLIVSITLPHHAPVNCARALDGIRNMIAPGLATKQSWEVLRNTLNLSRDYLELITDTSAAPRHGDRTHIPGATVMEVSKRSWIIMDRFLHFRKRGNQPLPVADFPELS